MKLFPPYLIGSILSLALVGAAAQSAGSAAADVHSGPAGFSGLLQRIEQSRADMQARLDRDERACRNRFWVNSCLADAREKARREDQELDRQQRLVEHAVRELRERAAVERVQGKQEALVERQANTSPGLSDQDIGLRVLQAQQDRAIEAADKMEQQLRRQEAADRRNESRQASARERAERSRKGESAAPDAQLPGAPAANAQSQERRP